jgi:hypothetical protein
MPGSWDLRLETSRGKMIKGYSNPEICGVNKNIRLRNKRDDIQGNLFCSKIILLPTKNVGIYNENAFPNFSIGHLAQFNTDKLCGSTPFLPGAGGEKEG